MTDKTIRVLVVDDSKLVRELVCDFIREEPGLEVAGTASDGHEALVKLNELQPDIITLDVQMPRMDGMSTLDGILEQNATPVIMVSSLTQRAADTTLQALDRGALDYVAKPDSLTAAPGAFREELIRKLRSMAGADVRRVIRIRQARKDKPVGGLGKPTSFASEASKVPAGYENSCIALGISTGGPPALSNLFQELRPPLPGMLIVQHMPAQFTGPFAARLDLLSPLKIKEAVSGDELKPNHVLLAPGGKHMSIRRHAGKIVAHIFDAEPVSGHKPSVDVMMQSAAALYGNRCLGVVMTGMGYDGVEGCGAIHAAGGYVLGQNEATSDVYGMNKAAYVAGNVNKQFPLESLPGLISRECQRLFRGQTAKA